MLFSNAVMVGVPSASRWAITVQSPDAGTASSGIGPITMSSVPAARTSTFVRVVPAKGVRSCVAPGSKPGSRTSPSTATSTVAPGMPWRRVTVAASCAAAVPPERATAATVAIPASTRFMVGFLSYRAGVLGRSYGTSGGTGCTSGNIPVGRSLNPWVRPHGIGLGNGRRTPSATPTSRTSSTSFTCRS